MRTAPGGLHSPAQDEHSNNAAILTSQCPSAGLRLIHYAEKSAAVPGRTLTFFAWIINETNEDLARVRLILRSFANAGMEQLRYTTQPAKLSFGPMPAGSETEFRFTYVTTDNDRNHGGELISAMAVQAITASGKKLWDEHDALTPVAQPTQA